MSAKENNSEVALDKVDANEKSNSDAKSDVKGSKRPAEVSTTLYYFARVLYRLH